MTYSLEFVDVAKKERDTLDTTVRQQLKKKLIERLDMPKEKGRVYFTTH